MTPNPDGTVSIVANIEALPAEGMIVTRCDQPFDANGNCPGVLMVVRVPLTGTPSFIATPAAAVLVSPMAGFAHPEILGVIGGGILAALFLYGKWRRRVNGKGAR